MSLAEMNAINEKIMEYLDGGGSFRERTDARNFIKYANGLQFHLPGSATKHRINLVQIFQEENGSYGITFTRTAGFRIEWEKTFKGLAIYQLLPFIINQTGIGGL